MLTQESALKPLLKLMARGTPRSRVVVMRILRILLVGKSAASAPELKLVDSCLPTVENRGPRFPSTAKSAGVRFIKWILSCIGEATVAPAIASKCQFLKPMR